MSPELKKHFNHFSNLFETESKNYFKNESERSQIFKLDPFWQVLSYTYFLEAKRFRPFLSYLISDFFKKDFKDILPFAIAIELIHTYSLIHDDLPCMDNDDFRRGKPANHKVFGEAQSLLAGDALQAESFRLICSVKNCEAKNILNAIETFSHRIGVNGMVGGQVLDMNLQKKPSLEEIEKIHLLKTSCLIEAAVIGSAHLCGSSTVQIKKFSEYSSGLGLAFQIKDDLLDYSDKQQDFKNIVNIIGLSETQSYLENVSQRALSSIYDQKNELLENIINYNLQRVK